MLAGQFVPCPVASSPGLGNTPLQRRLRSHTVSVSAHSQVHGPRGHFCQHPLVAINTWNKRLIRTDRYARRAVNTACLCGLFHLCRSLLPTHPAPTCTLCGWAGGARWAPHVCPSHLRCTHCSISLGMSPTIQSTTRT